MAGNPSDFVESIAFTDPNVGATLFAAPNVTGFVSILFPLKVNDLLGPDDAESVFWIDPPKPKEFPVLLGNVGLPKILFVLAWLDAEKLKVDDDGGLETDEEPKIFGAMAFFSGSVLLIELA